MADIWQHMRYAEGLNSIRIRQQGAKMDFKNLDKFRTGGTTANMLLEIPLPLTPDGRIYRYSPNATAHPRHFVLGPVIPDFAITDDKRTRMKLEPRSKQTVCPYSGIIDDDEKFVHPDDREAAIETVKHAAMRDMQDAIDKAFGGFNRKSSGSGFLRIETKYTPGRRKPAPRFARRDLMRELVCDHCGRDYAVFAIGLFCCDCGAPNLRLHFAREVELVRKQVDLANGQKDQEELAYRLLGNAHEDVLTAFEATLKAVYLYGMASRGKTTEDFRPVGNDFQNVEKGQRRYAALGFDPYAVLDADALSSLKLNIQKRHILGHNLGVMDAKFAVHDDEAKVGETVRLVAGDVIAFADSCQRIVDALDACLPETGETNTLPALPTAPLTPETIVPKKEKSTLGLNLSQLAERVGLWIAQNSETGLSAIVQSEILAKAFASEEPAALIEAIAELEMDGYLTTIALLNREIPPLRPTVDLYVTFDPYAMKTDPLTDAAELTKAILAGDDSVRVKALHEASGMTLRRFNPALALVIANIDDRRVSQEINTPYPTGSFFMMATDRVTLKRFLSRTEG